MWVPGHHFAFFKCTVNAISGENSRAHSSSHSCLGCFLLPSNTRFYFFIQFLSLFSNTSWVCQLQSTPPFCLNFVPYPWLCSADLLSSIWCFSHDQLFLLYFSSNKHCFLLLLTSTFALNSYSRVIIKLLNFNIRPKLLFYLEWNTVAQHRLTQSALTFLSDHMAAGLHFSYLATGILVKMLHPQWALSGSFPWSTSAYCCYSFLLFFFIAIVLV